MGNHTLHKITDSSHLCMCVASLELWEETAGTEFQAGETKFSFIACWGPASKTKHGCAFWNLVLSAGQNIGPTTPGINS